MNLHFIIVDTTFYLSYFDYSEIKIYWYQFIELFFLLIVHNILSPGYYKNRS